MTTEEAVIFDAFLPEVFAFVAAFEEEFDDVFVVALFVIVIQMKMFSEH